MSVAAAGSSLPRPLRPAADRPGHKTLWFLLSRPIFPDKRLARVRAVNATAPALTWGADMKRNRSARILCSSLVPGAAAALVGAQAIAQTPPAAEPKDNMDEVIVTGSRIASPNATSTSPVQVVTRQDMQVSGKTDITDIISQLPQNFTNDLDRTLATAHPA